MLANRLPPHFNQLKNFFTKFQKRLDKRRAEGYNVGIKSDERKQVGRKILCREPSVGARRRGHAYPNTFREL